MRNKLLLIIAAGGLLLASVMLAGCFGKVSSPSGAAEPAVYLTVQDSTGKTVTLTKKPERIVVLSPSILDLLYAIDGKAVGRPSSKSSIPVAAVDVPEVGYVYNINLEKTMALQPDLVIAVQGMHEKLVPALENSHIPVLVLKYKTLEDTMDTIRILGGIAGTQAKAEQIIKDMQSMVQEITAKLPPDKTTKIAILHATAKSVTVELDTTIAGSIAKQLGLINLAAGSAPIDTDGDTIPYSLEKLVAADPDILFVVTMGDKADIQKRMQADVESNPAWASMRAVQQKKVCFLPSDLFLLNPGLKMPEAVQYMAKLIYPEVYGSAK